MRLVFLKTVFLTLLLLIPNALHAESIAFSASDGQVLRGNYMVGPSRNVVILLHMKARTHQDLEFLADKLHQKNFSVLNFDMRGHGESLINRNGKMVYWDELDRSDYQMMAQDLQQAINYIRSREGANASITLLGLDLGATVILDFLSQQVPEQKYFAVLVSPGLDYGDLDINSQKLDKLAGREMLLLNAKDDSYSLFSCQYLIQRLGSKEIRTRFVGGSRHGTTLLFEDTRLTDWLIKFLQKRTVK